MGALLSRRSTPRRLVAVLVALTLTAALGCSRDGADEPAAAPSPPSTSSPIPPCETSGQQDAPPAEQGSKGAVGNDPFTARGARQVPGPDMTTTTVPATPVSVVVQPPPNPDQHVAASQVDGKPTGPIPDPRGVISATTSTSVSEQADGDRRDDPTTTTDPSAICLPAGSP